MHKLIIETPDVLTEDEVATIVGAVLSPRNPVVEVSHDGREFEVFHHFAPVRRPKQSDQP